MAYVDWNEPFPHMQQFIIILYFCSQVEKKWVEKEELFWLTENTDVGQETKLLIYWGFEYLVSVFQRWNYGWNLAGWAAIC